MSYWYVGSPYSKYHFGIEEAFREACRNSALLIQAGIPIYSPIAHTHPVALYGNIDPLDHGIWMSADAPLMEAACGLIVLKMAGWEESYGVSEEMNYFHNAGKPIVFMTPGIVPFWDLARARELIHANAYPKGGL